MRVLKIVLSFCLVLLLSSFHLSAYAGYDTPLDLVSSYANSHYGGLETDYQNGNKHIAIFSGSFPVLVGAGASLWVDLDDYNYISEEGGEPSDPNNNWVTMWIMANGSLVGAGTPVGISITSFPVDEDYQDPRNAAELVIGE